MRITITATTPPTQLQPLSYNQYHHCNSTTTATAITNTTTIQSASTNSITNTTTVTAYFNNGNTTRFGDASSSALLPTTPSFRSRPTCCYSEIFFGYSITIYAATIVLTPTTAFAADQILTQVTYEELLFETSLVETNLGQLRHEARVDSVWINGCGIQRQN